MKNIIIIGILLISGCAFSNYKKPGYTNNSDSNLQNNSKSVDLLTSRYFYSKNFDIMVEYSLTHGFDLNDQFGSENSYGIIKTASNLAINGDSIVIDKMFNFIYDLVNSNKNYEVDHSISVLLDFYLGLDNEKLFAIGIEFLDPSRLYSKKQSNDDYGTDYTTIFYTKLQNTMILEDREFYNKIFINLYVKAIKSNSQNVPFVVWNEFFPYLKKEFAFNKIQFIEN